MLKPYSAELAGTFLLTTAVNLCKRLAPAWATPWALGLVTAALAYALGPVAGGHFNPAACVGLGVLGRLQWVAVAGCCAAQVVGGILAGLAASSVSGDGAAAGPSVCHAGSAEALYAFMLSFVVMNASRSHAGGRDPNAGLAAGLVYVASGSVVGSTSDGHLNPAIAIGVALPGLLAGKGGVLGALACVVCHFIGSAAAVGAFILVRPEEHDFDFGREAVRARECACEFVGAFMFVVTVGLNLALDSANMLLSAVACLVSLTHAVGDVSGANFNPALSLSVLVSGREQRSARNGALYSLMHMGAGLLAGALLGWYHISQVIVLRDVRSIQAGCFAEFLFTFLFAFDFVALASAGNAFCWGKADVLVGLAVGLCVAFGGVAVESIVLAGLNPAVTLGLTAASACHTRADWGLCVHLIFSDLLAGAAACAFVRMTDKDELGPLVSALADQLASGARAGSARARALADQLASALRCALAAGRKRAAVLRGGARVDA